MGNSGLAVKILMEMEALIARTCAGTPFSESSRLLHKEIVRGHYGAFDVLFDYDRQTVAIIRELPEDDPHFQEGESFTQVVRTDIVYDDLDDFLTSCLSSDAQSLAMYTRLLKRYGTNEFPVVAFINIPK